MLRCALLLFLVLTSVACDLLTYDPVKKGKDAPIIADAKLFRVAQEIVRLTTEAEQYHSLKGEWPPDWQALRRGGRDPWGEEYILEFEGNRAIVFSSGPDGEIGTDDDVYGR